MGFFDGLSTRRRSAAPAQRTAEPAARAKAPASSNKPRSKVNGAQSRPAETQKRAAVTKQGNRTSTKPDVRSGVSVENEERLDFEPELPFNLETVAVLQVERKTITLFVMESSRNDPEILSEASRFKRRGAKVILKTIDADELARRRESQKNRGVGSDHRVVSLILTILKRAAKNRISDIHIEVRGHTRIKMRENGRLVEIKDLELDRETGEALCRSFYQGYSNAAGGSYNRHADQAAQITDPTVLPESVEAVRLQRSPMHPDGAEFMVLRLLYRKVIETSIQTAEHAPDDGVESGLEDGIAIFERYGYTRDQAMIIAKAARQPEGMVIFSGPTGSGKSTALKNALEFQALIYPDKSIFTIEDPPEYVIVGAKQIPVQQTKTDEERVQAFDRALRVAMRSDPDILMVSEMRDRATGGSSLDAVITGHQMWTTTHAQDPYLVISRLIRFGLDVRDFLDPAILRVLGAQRLVPTPCPECSITLPAARDRIDRDVYDAVVRYGEVHDCSINSVRVRTKTPSCSKCGGEGVVGRKVVAEMVPVSDRLIDHFDGGHNVRAARIWQRSQPEHMSLIGHAMTRAFAGEVDPRDVVAFVGEVPKVED